MLEKEEDHFCLKEILVLSTMIGHLL